MPKVKLTYFATRAKAEVIRLLLAYGNVDYENFRVDFEDWPLIKPSKSALHS
jgi:glutathione S-transferase